VIFFPASRTRNVEIERVKPRGVSREALFQKPVFIGRPERKTFIRYPGRSRLRGRTGPGKQQSRSGNRCRRIATLRELHAWRGLGGAVTNIPVGSGPRKIVAQTAAARQRSSSRRVTITGFAFMPALLELSPGETVTWMNDDRVPSQHSRQERNGFGHFDARIELWQRFWWPGRLWLSLLDPSLHDRQNNRHGAPASVCRSI